MDRNPFVRQTFEMQGTVNGTIFQCLNSTDGPDVAPPLAPQKIGPRLNARAARVAGRDGGRIHCVSDGGLACRSDSERISGRLPLGGR